MEAILKFDLSNFDDSMDYALANKATEMALVLWELSANGKRNITHELEADPNLSEKDVFDGVEMVFKRLFDLMEEHDINIDKLIQ